MQRRGWVLALALFVVAFPSAQASLIVLTFHPAPDRADPLGVPFAEDRDAFAIRHGALAGDGIFPFPSIVVDGLQSVLGLPNASRPYVDTLSAYESAFNARSSLESPIGLRIAADAGSLVSATINATPRLPLGAMRLWAGLVEDHVAFRPPPAVSNGVFDHRFTVRAITDLGDVALDGARERQVAWPVDASWSSDRLYVAAWVEAEGPGLGRFEPGEVVQAALHRVGDAPTTHGEKGVLLEMYSATWCDTCLYGDRVAAELAEANPAATYSPAAAQAGYLVAAQRPVVAGLAAVAAAAMVAMLVRKAR